MAATMSNRIGIEEIAGIGGVNPSDYATVQQLATAFYGLTHTGGNDREARKFCILSALRVLGEMRALVAARGF